MSNYEIRNPCSRKRNDGGDCKRPALTGGFVACNQHATEEELRARKLADLRGRAVALGYTLRPMPKIAVETGESRPEESLVASANPLSPQASR